MKGIGNAFGILGVGALVAAALTLPVDARQINPWKAFLGCWTPSDEIPGDGVLCFREAGDGVDVFRVVAGEATSTERLIADGQPRNVPNDDCAGTRAVDFSSDGRRAFTRSELACAGETRSSSGLMAFVAPTRWIDARSIGIGGEQVALLQEYSPVSPEWFIDAGIPDPLDRDRGTVLAMRVRAAGPIGTREVQEAVSRVGADAVELWVAVQPSEFDFNGDQIVRLVDGGVPESVIDVMVAVSYPDRFVLSLDGPAAVAPAAVADIERNPPGVRYFTPYRGLYRNDMFDPFFLPRFHTYGAFGFPLPGYYILNAPGAFSGHSGGGGPGIVIEPRPPSVQGRMVNGRGYTRGSSSPRSARPAGGRSSGASSSGVGVSPVTTASSAEPSSPTLSSGSGGSSSPGAGSSSGTSTGRTARPRN
jgi:hypothetical protein